MVATCEAKRRGDAEPVVSRFSMADAKRAGLAGKTGPWTQYPKRMLQMRARGFALRDAFPDLLRGFVTAEEAQDYPTPEPAREPVVVRPKFTTPPPPAAERDEPSEPARATADDMYRARNAVQQAKTVEQLKAIRAKVEKRLVDEGFYTDAQADELFLLVEGKLEFLGEEVRA